jgi:hypothetical protein
VKPILRKASICNIFNDEHEIRCKVTIFFGVQGDVFDFFLNEINHAKRWCSIPHVS